jgi:hypothetical protein
MRIVGKGVGKALVWVVMVYAEREVGEVCKRTLRENPALSLKGT